MNPVKTPLFETPPTEGELWYDVQFEALKDPADPSSRTWMYFSGVPSFKSGLKAQNWIKRFQARAQAVGFTLPSIRLKAHFESWEEVAGVWRGQPCPKELIPEP